MASGRATLVGAGANNTSALAFGGLSGTSRAETEEFTDPGIITKTLTS